MIKVLKNNQEKHETREIKFFLKQKLLKITGENKNLKKNSIGGLK